jgi:hypothetical protein
LSDNYLQLIPNAPSYVPPEPAREEARALFASLVPDAHEVKVEVSDEIRFIDCGANWDSVYCPFCSVEPDPSWWADAMEAAEAHAYARLDVTMPCCGRASSLNDLRYPWRVGFARFVLSALNPNLPELPPEALRRLSQMLGCELRVIWAHD